MYTCFSAQCDNDKKKLNYVNFNRKKNKPKLKMQKPK